MKLSELKVIVDRASKHAIDHDDDPEVVIQTSQGGVPSKIKAHVKNAMRGFDWEHGKFIIYPEELIVLYRPIEMPLQDFAEKRLEELKAAHTKLGFKFIAKAREQEWLDGFEQGVREFRILVDEANKDE